MTQETGLPEEVSLGEILSKVMVSPAEAAHMLQAWAQEHSGGGQPNLTAKLQAAAADVTTTQAAKDQQRDAAAHDAEVAKAESMTPPPILQPAGTTQPPDVTRQEETQDTSRQDVNRPLDGAPVEPHTHVGGEVTPTEDAPVPPDQNR